ncbi:MAG: flagellar hook assembly protein FlgD [Desulfobacterales bacterium]
MSIASVNNTSYSTSSTANDQTSSNSGTDKIGMDQFLNLFIAQMKNQDPLNPMDSAEFTAQLAQFSSVEQLYGMNSKLSNIEETLSSQSDQQDNLGYIGKTIKANDNTMIVEDGTVQTGIYSIDESGDVTLDVYDSEGQKVRTLYLGSEDKGEHEVDWNGRDDAGNMVEDGTYMFEITARDGNGLYIPSNTYISGEVTGLTYKNGQPYLMIGDKIINSSNIIEVRQTTANN